MNHFSKGLLSLALIFVTAISFAQVSITVNVPTAGGFSTALTAAGGDPNTVTNLTVTGNLNGTDIQYMNESMPVLAVLDMELVIINDNKIPIMAFNGKKSLTNIKLPKSITSIDNYAFCNCSNIKGNLVIPNGVMQINYRAFYGCTGFTGDLIIPNSVTYIGIEAFCYCTGFNGTLTLSNSLTTIDNEAFRYCSGLTGNLTFPNSITSIMDYAFEDCSSLTGNLVLPNTLNTIHDHCFSNCIGLTGNLVIPSSVTSLENNAFYGCKGFTGSLTIPNSVTKVGKNVFEDCTGFNGLLTISNSINSLGSNAFKNCINLTGTISIPPLLTKIEPGIFFNCCRLTGTIILPNSVTSIGSTAFNQCKGLTGNLVIPNSVTGIGDYAFGGCSGLTGNLNIPNSVTSIGKNAFENCSGFTGNLTIPNSITNLGDYAFYGCSGFSGSLTIPNSITSINQYVFDQCSGLTGSLIIPNSVKYIGDAAFAYCSNLTGSLIIPNSVTYIGNSAFRNCSGFTGTLIIPATISKISSYTFGGCSGLTGLTIPNSILSIGDYAFQNCKGLNGNLVIPSSVTSIGSFTFINCSNLIGLTMPNTVKTIGAYAFRDCTSLTGNLTIPNSVTSIGDRAFYGCSGFTGNLIIPNSITSLGEGTFFNCSNLTGSLTIPNSITNLGDYAFYGCSKLTGGLSIPNSVKTIGLGTFGECSGLSGTLTIPSSVTSIGDAAFWNCSNINRVTAAQTVPLTIESSVFVGINKTTCQLVVPYGSTAAYRAANGWKDFVNITELIYVTFNSQGGTPISDLNPTYNTTIPEPNAPTRTGYTFSGWYKDEACTNIWNFSTELVTTNTTLYAKWIINTYIVNFYSNGGSDLPDITVDYNSLIVEPTTPTLTGYTFAGWYKEATFTNAWNFATDRVIENTILYAKWTINTYTINFNTNGGTPVSNVTAFYNTTISQPPTPTKTGYTFAGWYTDAMFNNYFDYEVYYITSNLTLYARWDVNNYNVKFNTNGGTLIFDIKVDYNSTIPRPQDPEWLGYTFNGWYKDSNFSTLWNFNTDKVYSDMTLYAKWTIKTYTVHFDSQGGNTIANGSVNHGEKVTEPTPPTKTGYTFKNWYNDPTEGQTWQFDWYTVTQDTTLYAHWDINSYTITFDSKGGSDVASITSEYNSKIDAPTSPIKTGYTFAGWYKDEALTSIWDFNSDVVTTNATLYAKWTINTYTVTFNSQGGSAISNISVNYNSTISEPTSPTRTDYTFKGWYKESDCINSWIFASDVVTSDITLYAKWNLSSDVETISGNSIKLYPNPVISSLTIEGENIEEISVYNLIGVKVLQPISALINGKYTFSVDLLKSGVYLAKVKTTGNKTTTIKFIKQ